VVVVGGKEERGGKRATTAEGRAASGVTLHVVVYPTHLRHQIIEERLREKRDTGLRPSTARPRTSARYLTLLCKQLIITLIHVLG
jgi:hypothetical protein